MVSQLDIASRASHTLEPLPSPQRVDGLVQVFTCTQRDFLADVMAQAMRIAGQGTPVLMVQFLKGGIGQGCDRPIHLVQNLDWIRCGLSRVIDAGPLTAAETATIRAAWEHVCATVQAQTYDMVVLDELSLAISLGVIRTEEVVEFLRDRPSYTDIILTGPQMPDALLDAADRITEIRRHRHL